MAITYEVNGTGITSGIMAEWQPITTGGNADGTQKLSANWLRHIWRLPVCEVATYLILTALRGTSLTSLKTTDESSPNSTATYATGRVLTVTGQHRARQVLGVEVVFLVDTTS